MTPKKSRPIKYQRKPKIKLAAASTSILNDLYGPEEITVYGALGCFEEETPFNLFLKDKQRLNYEQFHSKKERILKETSGRGHGSVLDQAHFTFVIENIPRLATLQLCLPQYLEHLQQSLRRAKANRGFYLPNSITNSPVFEECKKELEKSFTLYERFVETGVPAEDARYLLPLYTRTNIQTTGNAREIMHLHHMSRHEYTPSIVRETIEEIIKQCLKECPALFKKRETNYEALAWYPSAQLFSQENTTLTEIIEKTQKHNFEEIALLGYAEIPITQEGIKKAVLQRNEAELANLKHLHFTFLAKMSLATLHQAIRQRTWDQSTERIYVAASREEIITPPSIKNKQDSTNDMYQWQNKQMIKLYKRLIKSGIPMQEAIGVLPHSLAIYNLIHINGWNAIHSIGKRTCTEAQWEIRKIAKKMAEKIKETNPLLGQYINPQGVLYERCPEKKPCGYCDAYIQKKK